MVLGFETFCAPLLRNLLSVEPVGSPRPEQYHSDRKQREYRSCSHHRVVVCTASISIGSTCELLHSRDNLTVAYRKKERYWQKHRLTVPLVRQPLADSDADRDGELSHPAQIHPPQVAARRHRHSMALVGRKKRSRCSKLAAEH